MKTEDINDYSSFHLNKHKCKSWLCAKCAVAKGFRVRQILLQKAHLFSFPRLFTFTVDPKNFDGPESAYRFVRDKKFIPILMRLIGVKKWVCVFEVQKNGFPHWHLLADISCLPDRYVRRVKSGFEFRSKADFGFHLIKNFVDLTRVHRLWLSWGIGSQVNLSRVKGVSSPVHAVNYITKYLCKPPRGAWPDWLLQETKLRILSASKAVGSLGLSGSESTVSEEVSDDEEKEERIYQPHFLRVAACGLKIDVFDVDNRYLTTLPFQIKDLKAFGMLINESCIDDVTGKEFSRYGIEGRDFKILIKLACSDDFENEFLYRRNLTVKSFFPALQISDPFEVVS